MIRRPPTSTLFPTRRSSDLSGDSYDNTRHLDGIHWRHVKFIEQFTADRREGRWLMMSDVCKHRSEEHTSELQSLTNLVCRLLLEKKKKKKSRVTSRRNTNCD